MNVPAPARLRLVLASNNAAKLAELGALFGTLAIDLLAQPSLRITEAEEPHPTFVENALAKARHASRLAGAAAVADDSGLCVDALGGAPGVASAHYAAVDVGAGGREVQRRVQDDANNCLLLQRLDGVPNRRAHFVCTLVALRAPDDPQPLIATGRWQGEVLHSPRGDAGFGYDPLLSIPALGCSVAQMSKEQKNALSHRALACVQMRALLREHWQLQDRA